MNSSGRAMERMVDAITWYNETDYIFSLERKLCIIWHGKTVTPQKCNLRHLIHLVSNYRYFLTGLTDYCLSHDKFKMDYIGNVILVGNKTYLETES